MKLAALLLTGTLAGMATIAHAQLKTPAPSPHQTITQAFGLDEVKVEYSRPGAKDRKVFGGLVPYNKIWRTGANAATQITFGEDVTIGGKALKAGTYAIYTKPTASNWDIMFYSDLKMGGNVSKYNTVDEVLKINVPAVATKDFTETFTIDFQDILSNTMNLVMMWEHTKVAIPVAVEIDEKIMKNIAAMEGKEDFPYFQAANYYYANDKDLNKALDWTNEAISQNPKAFYMYALKARIELKQNNKAAAAATAKDVIKYSKEAKNDDYVKIGEGLLKQAQG